MVCNLVRLAVATAVVATQIGQKPVIMPPPNIYGEFRPTPGVEAPDLGIAGLLAETNATPRVVSIDSDASLKPDAGAPEALPEATIAQPHREEPLTFTTPMTAGPVVGRVAEDHDATADWVETFQTDMAGIVEHMRFNDGTSGCGSVSVGGGKTGVNNCHAIHFRNDIVEKITPSWFVHPFSFLASDARALMDTAEKGQRVISKAMSGAVVGIVVMALVLVVLSYAWRQRMNRHEDAAVRIQAAYRGSTERTSILSAVTSVDAPGDRSPLTDDR